MIASEATNDPSPHVRRRSRTMRVKMLTPFSYLVTPSEPDKVKRVVHFDYCDDTGVVRIDCSAWNTGESCQANEHSQMCSHVNAAVHRLLNNAKRNDRLESKAAKRNQQIQEYAQKVIDETEQPELKGISK